MFKQFLRSQAGRRGLFKRRDWRYVLRSIPAYALMTRFLIVDDHPLFREALQSAVRIAHAEAEVFEAASIEGAIDVADAHRDLDLALLDLSLPGTTGFPGLMRFRSALSQAARRRRLRP